MQKKYYLKKIITAVESKCSNEFFQLQAQRIAEDGIVFEQIESEAEQNKNFIPEQVEISKKEKDVLWITDCSWIANVLAQEAIPFVVFLHSGNKNQDFSMARFGMEEPREVDVTYLDNIYRRFAGISWDILETKRCLIRETSEKDIDDFYRIYSEPSIVEYTEDLYPEIEEERQYIRNYIEKVYSFFQFGVWTVVLKDTGKVIGRAGFSYREGYEEPELGFVIGLPWQRQGIAFEICSAILSYGHTELGFDRVQAFVEPDNEVSLSLCKKLGFVVNENVIEKEKKYLRLLKKYKI